MLRRGRRGVFGLSGVSARPRWHLPVSVLHAARDKRGHAGRRRARANLCTCPVGKLAQEGKRGHTCFLKPYGNCNLYSRTILIPYTLYIYLWRAGRRRPAPSPHPAPQPQPRRPDPAAHGTGWPHHPIGSSALRGAIGQATAAQLQLRGSSAAAQHCTAHLLSSIYLSIYPSMKALCTRAGLCDHGPAVASAAARLSRRPPQTAACRSRRPRRPQSSAVLSRRPSLSPSHRPRGSS